MKRMVWVVSSGLIVAALVLASCAPAVTEEEEVAPTKEEVVAVPEKKVEVAVTEGAEMVPDSLGILKEKPRYGGTARYVWTGTGSLGYWDPAAPVPGMAWHYSNMYDVLAVDDFTKGPSGTGELAFTIEMIPDRYKVGELAESFEQLDLTTVVYHLRQGVHYHNKWPVNGRELVADDVVFAVERAQSDPRSDLYKRPGTPPEDLIRATARDRYTVEIKLPEPKIRTISSTSYLFVYPPELIEEYGNLDDWRHHVGSGPYILVDNVPDSSMTYVRNENYWGHDVFFPENQVPYMDGYTYINVPDMTTSLAALRTAKIDRLSGVSREDAKRLMESHPEMSYSPALVYWQPVVEMRNDLEPFSDIRVRKALAIGIDRKGIVRDLYDGEAVVHSWPYSPYLSSMNIYTPLEELPPEVQELFDYSPEKAKQLLAEAGYPNGFKTEILITAGHTDMAQIVKMYWDAIGVETTVEVMETGTFYSRMYNWGYQGTAMVHWPSVNPYDIWGWAYYKDRPYNYSKVSDDWIVELSETVQVTEDEGERERMLREGGVRALTQVYNIGLPVTYSYVFWWPWLKGYNGEQWGGYDYRWLDVELKKEMTGGK